MRRKRWKRASRCRRQRKGCDLEKVIDKIYRLFGRFIGWATDEGIGGGEWLTVCVA
jgi:hypothetical protein